MRHILGGVAAAALLSLGWVVVGPGAAADSKAKFVMSAEEKELLGLINKEREKENLKPLKPNPELFKAARLHSANMAKQGKMEHNLDGKTPFQRIKAAGYAYRYAGENIAWGDLPMEDIVKGWMNSKPHRENILNSKYTETGLGRVVDDKGAAWYTEVFGQPLK